MTVQAPHDDIAVMVCLPVEEPEAEPVLAAAAQLARDLRGSLRVVHVYPSNWRRRPEDFAFVPLDLKAASWHLSADDPTFPLLKFAEQHRVTHLVLGPRASQLWGSSLSSEAGGRLTLSCFLPDAG